MWDNGFGSSLRSATFRMTIGWLLARVGEAPHRHRIASVPRNDERRASVYPHARLPGATLRLAWGGEAAVRFDM